MILALKHAKGKEPFHTYLLIFVMNKRVSVSGGGRESTAARYRDFFLHVTPKLAKLEGLWIP